MKFILLAFATLFSVTVISAQNKAPQKISIDSALGYFKDNFPQEKVLLQTDKNIYAWGETVWMKIWCTVDGVPSFLSRIVYIDLVDDAGKVVLKKMYKLDSLSTTPADFDLPAEIKSGNYSINAYSLWMLNFPQFITSKSVFIYGSEYKINASKNVQTAIKMAFFPEGGDLVEGIENKVAYKIYDQNGYPLNLKGTITDDAQKTVASFSAEHDGMGSFVITPEKGKSYLSNIVVSGGSALQFKLPKAKDEGVNITVANSTASRITVLVNRAENNKDKYSKLKIVGQMNGRIVYAQLLNIDEGQTAAAIAKKNLPAGIMQVTLFSENDVPLCERIVFVENYSVVKPKLTVEMANTKPRSLNKVSMDVPSVNKSSMSVRVTDDTGLSDSASLESNIASSLFITSDLKGYINNPGYYVKDKNPSTLHDLDLLLMTQGWRRFDWKKILNNEFATLKYPVESAMAITGLVTKSDRKDVVKNGFVSFIIKTSDSATILAEAKLTDKGEFLLNDLNFIKKASVAYMGTDENKKKYIVDIKLAPSYLDSLKSSANKALINSDTLDIANAKEMLAAYLNDKFKALDTTGSNGHYLGNVTVKAKKLSPIDSLNREYAEGPFLQGRGINPADYKNYRTIWQIIQAATPGITVSGNPFDPDVSFNRYQGLNAFSDNVSATSEETAGAVTESNGIAYFLNGMNVSKDIINTLSVDDVAFIKVLKHEASVLGASQGAIAVYTVNGVTGGANPYDKTYSKLEKEGYALTKEFYAPDYQLDPTLNKGIADKRYLLLWNPKPRTGKDGKYHFTFFNNDSGKKYRIIVQGIDSKGNLIFGEQTIK